MLPSDIFTVATLPSASSRQGYIALVTDATVPEAQGSGSVVAGGGTVRARVRSDGTNWRVYGWVHGGGGTSAVNLITNQDLSNPYWTLSGFTYSTGNNIRETAASSAHTFGMTTGLTRPVGTGIYTHSVDLIKAGPDQRFLDLGIFSIGLGSGGSRYFDVLSGTSSASSSYGGFSVTGFAMTAITGGWRCSITVDCTGSANAGVIILDQDTTPLGTFTYLGVVADGYTVSNLTLVRIG